MPKRPRAAEEELQRGGRSAGLPGVGEREEWASGRREAAPRSLSPTPARTRPPYVREKTFLEASRWLRLVQQPRASAANSCGRRVWATPTEDRAPPPAPGLPSGLGPGHRPYRSSPHRPPSHSVQGGFGAREIQERQNIRTAQETIEALMRGQGREGVRDHLTKSSLTSHCPQSLPPKTTTHPIVLRGPQRPRVPGKVQVGQGGVKGHIGSQCPAQRPHSWWRRRKWLSNRADPPPSRPWPTPPTSWRQPCLREAESP